MVDEFQKSIRTEGPEATGSNEFAEFTDADFETFLEGQREKVAGAESAYSVRLGRGYQGSQLEEERALARARRPGANGLNFIK